MSTVRVNGVLRHKGCRSRDMWGPGIPEESRMYLVLRTNSKIETTDFGRAFGESFALRMEI